MNPQNKNTEASPLKRLDGEPVFAEAWQAQVLAIVDTLISSGQLSPGIWSKAFGKTLKKANARGAADTTETYYAAALETLESLLNREGKLLMDEILQRQEAWRKAYLSTPHGQAVELEKT